MRNAECQCERRRASDLSLQFHTPHSAFRIRGGVVTAWDSGRVAAALAVSGPRGLTFSAVSTDTRALMPGTLFVALKGDRFDAHAFLDQARAKGASAAVVRRGTAPVDGLPYFEVADTLVALGLLARARRRSLAPGSPVVAVTGSKGKNRTDAIIPAGLATTHPAPATRRDLDNLVAVALTILPAPARAQAPAVAA